MTTLFDIGTEKMEAFSAKANNILEIYTQFRHVEKAVRELRGYDADERLRLRATIELLHDGIVELADDLRDVFPRAPLVFDDSGERATYNALCCELRWIEKKQAALPALLDELEGILDA